ncbi:LysR substrate-binding domain-containing protein [Sporosarcina thermotolerans]
MISKVVDDLTNKASCSLSIGASYTFGEYVLPRIIANSKHTYPDIQPTVTIGNETTISDLVAQYSVNRNNLIR